MSTTISTRQSVSDQLFDSLTAENTRLMIELSIDRQLLSVLEIYRNLSHDWRSQCVCRQRTAPIAASIDELDTKYHRLLDRKRRQQSMRCNGESSADQNNTRPISVRRLSHEADNNADINEDTVVTAGGLEIIDGIDTLPSNDCFNDDRQLMDDSRDVIINGQSIDESTDDGGDSYSADGFVAELAEQMPIKREMDVNITKENVSSLMTTRSRKTCANNSQKSRPPKRLATKRSQMKISDETRSEIIDHMINGMGVVQVANIYGLNISTVSMIMKRYRDFGYKTKQKTGHRKPLLSPHQKQTIIDWMDADCTQTLDQLAERLTITFGKKCCQSRHPIASTVREFHFSFKRMATLLEVDNSADTIEARYEFARRCQQLIAADNTDDDRPQQQRLVFCDTIIVQIWSRNRSPLGGGVVKRTATVRNRTYSISWAMSDRSVLAMNIQEIPANSEVQPIFVEFFGNFIANNAIITDNDNHTAGMHLIVNSDHNTDAVIEMVDNSGGDGCVGHDITFLPPFSPFLNPIEGLYTDWQTFIRQIQKPNNERDLHNNVIMNTNAFTDNRQTSHYVQHIKQLLNRCLNREVISGNV